MVIQASGETALFRKTFRPPHDLKDLAFISIMAKQIAKVAFICRSSRVVLLFVFLVTFMMVPRDLVMDVYVFPLQMWCCHVPNLT